MLTKRPRGTEDILGSDIAYWHFMEQVTRELGRIYGYQEIRTPMFEHTELFQRGVGETTDIVEKEMYSFPDRGNRSITLRPEGTAAVVRAYLENKLFAGPQPIKLYYLGPMFRYGRPQAGRLRQFHQFGIEVFGSDLPAVDAEVIALAMEFYRRLGLKNLQLHLNSVGCPKCRPVHRERLQQYLKPKFHDLCETCRNRFERNPLRILDCKNEKCSGLTKEAPMITDNLCNDCHSHFQDVKNYLDQVGIAYVVDPKLVRGLDYYTKTAFEIEVQGIGAQSSIGGGGRYNGLVEECGGQDTPGIGFGLGLDRVVLTMKQQGIVPADQTKLQAYIVTAGEEAELSMQSFKLLQKLRKNGVSADRDYLGRSLKAQFKSADKSGADYTIILGSEENAKGVVSLKNMANGDQLEIAQDKLAEYILEMKER